MSKEIANNIRRGALKHNILHGDYTTLASTKGGFLFL